LKKIKGITDKIDSMTCKTDAKPCGKEGALPNVNIVLKDIAGKLQKLDTTYR
jgi:hypothetical protein